MKIHYSNSGGVGPQGPTGPIGLQGLTGNQGIQGPSIQGTTGSQGIQGNTGIQGTLGTQGVTGLQGLQGTQGPVGTPITSLASASYFSVADQGPYAANTISAMTFTDTDWEQGVTLVSGSQITMTNAGKYNIQFSAQIKQANANGVINIWLRKNGLDVDSTNTKLDINASSPFSVAAWNFFVSAEAGAYYQIMWSSNSQHTSLEYVPAGTHPEIPSVILTVNQIG